MLGLFAKSFGVVSVLFLSIMVATLGSNFSSEKLPGSRASYYEVMAVLSGDQTNVKLMNETDSLALVAFYKETNGGNWSNKNNWLTGPVTSWFGVTVTNGRVTRLELPLNNVAFTGQSYDERILPAEIGQLTELEVLNLERNDRLARIPPEIGELVNLKELNLAGCHTSGNYVDIVKLVKLEKLNLSLNTFGGELPAEIGNLIHLKELDLSGQSNSNFRGAIPAEITNLTQLEILNLSDNYLSGLPDLSPLDPIIGNGVLSEVIIDDNAFTFGDIEPNYSLSFAFSYANQYLKGPIDEYEGNELTLYASVGGAFSQYQWYKDGLPINGATGERYKIGPVTRDVVGQYEVEATNTLVTDLVLRSFPWEVEFIEEYTSKWLDIGAYHHAYSESGARHWGSQAPAGMEYPAILRHSGHIISNAF
ncbi:MAG: leucine-rich repeat domain-containing protein, partial [Rhodothermales bacterium]